MIIERVSKLVLTPVEIPLLALRAMRAKKNKPRLLPSAHNQADNMSGLRENKPHAGD